MPHKITLSRHIVTDLERKTRYGHEGAVIWLTGLSGSGKSSVAMALQQALCMRSYACYVLDGDNLRKGLSANLGFSPEDRRENTRRVGEVAALFADAGLVCITAVISPYREDRALARECFPHNFHEVHVAANLKTCETRDPKGLYRKARAGELLNFTGISAPYEPPRWPQLRLDTTGDTLEVCLSVILSYVLEKIPTSNL
jgi:adenylyl-sulfate kinase